MNDDGKKDADHEERLQKLEKFQALMERLEVQMADGNNGAVVFTNQNAVIRVGTQT